MLFRSTLFEAADQPGGQLRLAARVPRRRELIGIVDWRLARCTDAGVALRFNSYVGAEEVLAEAPEVVVVATGGLPNTEIFPAAELAASRWDRSAEHPSELQSLIRRSYAVLCLIKHKLGY